MNIIQKLNSNFKENKIFYLLVLSFFFIGILLGSYTIKYMDTVNANDLSNYFTEFIRSLDIQSLKSGELLINIIKSNIFIILIIILLGFTSFGWSIVLIIDLIKGFTLGYTFSFLITTFDGKGIYVAIASIIPQNIFYIPFFIGISIISLEISSSKLKSKIFKMSANYKLKKDAIIIKYGFFLVLFLIGIIVECYISPGIIKLVLTKAYKLT